MDKFFIRDKKTKEIVKELNNYPNNDSNKEIDGFDYDNYNIFIYQESNKPVIDSNKEYLEVNESFTTKISKRYPKVRIFERKWVIKPLSTNAILNNLNLSLGNHLDNQYPLWERIKHSGEGNYILWNKTEKQLTQEELDRKNKIDVVYAWIKGCREERDKREIEFLTNNITPSFEWENRPEKINN